MKIKKCKVENFGSYDSLEFDFASDGLTLISGPTGSGKSTLCDIIPWCLFGRTAKDGNADEVITWGSKEQTKGVTYVELSNGDTITVIRTRQPNDLYYYYFDPYSETGKIRGKDLKDTQKLINGLLGMDAELYLSGAYLNEFSNTSSFFIANAKTRKAIVEQLVDLTFTSELLVNLSNYKKELKSELDTTSKAIMINTRTIEANKSDIQTLEADSKKWKTSQKDKIANAIKMSESFSVDSKSQHEQNLKDLDRSKSEIQSEIEHTKGTIKEDQVFDEMTSMYKNVIAQHDTNLCTECGAPKAHAAKMVAIKALNNVEYAKHDNEKAKVAVSRLSHQVSAIDKNIAREHTRYSSLVNTWADTIITLKKEKSPHLSFIASKEEANELLGQETAKLIRETATLKQDLSDSEQLLDITNNFRELLSKNTIQVLQDRTNELLSSYFDAEIKVAFESDGADKIEVEVYKDGNVCTYSQLSKGQRQLLRLCFGVAVMKHISNHHGLTFSTVFFDEIFTGLDSSLILKGFSMLERLKSDFRSIYVVEHNNDAQATVDSTIRVSLLNGRSALE